MKKIYSVLLMVVIVAGMWYFNGSEEQKTNSAFVNKGGGDDDYIAGIDDEDEVRASESAASSKIDADLSRHEETKLEDGLSKVAYEDLEQPAPIGRDEIILFKNSFIVSYNMNTRCPNYVAWRLYPQRTKGSVQRLEEFSGDDVIAEGSRVETFDFNGSGYDRGHMCPAGDNKHDELSMAQSFLMTNICPQNHDLNEGDWKELEEQCRMWAKNYSDLFIVCGPIFDSRNPRRIGKRRNMKVAVPDRFFKVVLMMGHEPKSIGFIYPNRETKKDMRDYCVSVDEVEKITGIDFFPNLEDKIENKIERECKPAAWGI